MFKRVLHWAKVAKSELVAVYIASRDRRTPRIVKLIAISVVAYAFSPIDLIPDFIPVLGYLDDVLVVAAGVALVVKLTPEALMAEFRMKAQNNKMPAKNWITGTLFIALWIISGLFIGRWTYLHFYTS